MRMYIYIYILRSQSTKIHHVIDIEKLLGVSNLDEFINNTSF